MRKIQVYTVFILILLGILLLVSCQTNVKTNENAEAIMDSPGIVRVEAESFTSAMDESQVEIVRTDEVFVKTHSAGWLAFDVYISEPGRYTSTLYAAAESAKGVRCWIEDYYDNRDQRTYNITGSIEFHKSTKGFSKGSRDGSPLNAGLHKMKVHFDDSIKIDWIEFKQIRAHEKTPQVLSQQTEGENWVIAWSDEFDQEAIDTTKWTYDIGDWGWGNGELQYYTEGRTENARIENGNLIIEARKNDMGKKWTSARLTTRGKVSFLYGRIEFRAKVPSYKGNWAAGWTLGDEYVDELSWPYCGEIDILESVGYEMDDETGNGIAHASAHSGAYYFKLGNQPTGVIEVENMNNAYHTYAVEWMPDGIKAFVDGRHYVTYNDTSTDLSWPFSKPQNLILNMAIGGGWGGYYGIDESVDSQQMIIDYVRVYERR